MEILSRYQPTDEWSERADRITPTLSTIDGRSIGCVMNDEWPPSTFERTVDGEFVVSDEVQNALCTREWVCKVMGVEMAGGYRWAYAVAPRARLEAEGVLAYGPRRPMACIDEPVPAEHGKWQVMELFDTHVRHDFLQFYERENAPTAGRRVRRLDAAWIRAHSLCHLSQRGTVHKFNMVLHLANGCTSQNSTPRRRRSGWSFAYPLTHETTCVEPMAPFDACALGPIHFRAPTVFAEGVSDTHVDHPHGAVFVVQLEGVPLNERVPWTLRVQREVHATHTMRWNEPPLRELENSAKIQLPTTDALISIRHQIRSVQELPLLFDYLGATCILAHLVRTVTRLPHEIDNATLVAHMRTQYWHHEVDLVDAEKRLRLTCALVVDMASALVTHLRAKENASPRVATSELTCDTNAVSTQ